MSFVINGHGIKWKITIVAVTKKTYTWLNLFCIFTGCCYFLSSAINPFLYSLLSKRFRRGFHDLKRKVITGWRSRIFHRTLSRDNNDACHTPGPFPSLPNNYSFRCNTKPIHNRNALKRHFDIPLSLAAKCEDENQSEENQAMEMQGIVLPNGIRNGRGYTAILTSPPYNGKISQKAEELHNCEVEQIACMLKRNDEPLNCKYKVVFKTRENADTRVIVNPRKTRKEERKKNIQRCTGMNDLTNVGGASSTSSSAVYVTGHKGILGHTSYNSVPEDKLICNRLITSCSSATPAKDI